MASAYLHFLIVLLAAGLGNSNPSVVIVGAGPSGIAAATRLLKNGVDNITVLEAENRIGGRVYSVKFGDAYVDLGAEWCHGEKDNIVYEMIKNFSILDPGHLLSPDIYHSKLKLLDGSFTDLLFLIIHELFDEDREGTNETMGKYLERRYRDVVSQLWATDEEKLSLAYDSIDLYEKIVLENEGAFSWFSPAADNDYVKCEGNQELAWNGYGYKTILDVLMQKYPNPENALPIDDKILLNKEVSQIEWNVTIDGLEKAVVTCTDQSQYVADYVILTVSLGVLKNQHETLIVPGLPAEKIQAVEQLGIEAVFKMMLQFERPWWNSSFSGYSFVWSAEDLQHPDNFSEGPVKNGISWITSISTVIAVSGSPDVLSAWFAGEFVPEIENCTDETLINGFMHLMTRFEVWEVPVRPLRLIRNSWYSNPHFRGTYSFQTVEARADNQSKEVILSEPLLTATGKLGLMFAGEATHPTQFSTVHGAIRTGFREADRLLGVL